MEKVIQTKQATSFLDSTGLYPIKTHLHVKLIFFFVIKTRQRGERRQLIWSRKSKREMRNVFAFYACWKLLKFLTWGKVVGGTRKKLWKGNMVKRDFLPLTRFNNFVLPYSETWAMGWKWRDWKLTAKEKKINSVSIISFYSHRRWPSAILHRRLRGDLFWVCNPVI